MLPEDVLYELSLTLDLQTPSQVWLKFKLHTVRVHSRTATTYTYVAHQGHLEEINAGQLELVVTDHCSLEQGFAYRVWLNRQDSPYLDAQKTKLKEHLQQDLALIQAQLNQLQWGLDKETVIVFRLV